MVESGPRSPYNNGAMARATFVWIVRSKYGKLQILCSRNVPHDLSRLRQNGRADLVHIEAFPTSREAFAEMEGLKRMSKKQLKTLLKILNPSFEDLFPPMVAPDGRGAPISAEDFYLRLDLRNPEDDDFDPGPGNVPAYTPFGPRTLSGSAAKPIPREEKWVDHIGLRRYSEVAQMADR